MNGNQDKMNNRTVGVLHAGEMGAALAVVLRSRGMRVVTALRGRSESTVRRCREAGIDGLESMAEVARVADFVLSLVPPPVAEEIAVEYCTAARVFPANAVYVDLNSIRPELAALLASTFEQSGRSFVDGAINGLAKNLTSTATLFLSGSRAGEVAALFDGAVRTRVLGPDAGRASAMKMLLSGLSKGLCALFAELGLVAQQRDMLKEFQEASTEIYPGIIAVVDRMLPTYWQHATRRAGEMIELEETARAVGIEPCVIAAIRQMHETIADVQFGAPAGNGGWTVASLIRRLASEGCLSAMGSSKSTSV